MTRAMFKINVAMSTIFALIVLVGLVFEIASMLHHTMTMHTVVTLVIAYSIVAAVAAAWYNAYSKFKTAAIWRYKASAAF